MWCIHQKSRIQFGDFHKERKGPIVTKGQKNKDLFKSLIFCQLFVIAYPCLLYLEKQKLIFCWLTPLVWIIAWDSPKKSPQTHPRKIFNAQLNTFLIKCFLYQFFVIFLSFNYFCLVFRLCLSRPACRCGVRILERVAPNGMEAFDDNFDTLWVTNKRLKSIIRAKKERGNEPSDQI